MHPPRFYVADAMDADSVLRKVGKRADAAVLGFGVIVDVQDLNSLLASIEKLVVSGGVVVLSTLNKWCLFDLAWSLVHGKRPPRLFNDPIRTAMGVKVTPQYRSAGNIASELAARKWKVHSIRGVGWFAPPPYVDPLLIGPARRLLTSVDSRFSSSVAARLADMVWVVATTPDPEH